MGIIVNNKKAKFNYEVLTEYQAGLMLVGSEVKPAKGGKVSISEAYCVFKDNDLYITGMHISNPEISQKVFGHDETRERKLLLRKRELLKIKSEIATKGLTVVPLKLIVTDTGFLKLIIGVSRGKKNRDKRNSIKEKDIKRDIERTI